MTRTNTLDLILDIEEGKVAGETLYHHLCELANRGVLQQLQGTYQRMMAEAIGSGMVQYNNFTERYATTERAQDFYTD